MSATVRLLDLFAGAGGMSRGFLDVPGFKVVGAVENDLQAAATFAANFGEKLVRQADIADYTNVPQADVVIGGPPCQGFSNLGSKDPADPRNALFGEFVRVVKASKADVFVFENVNRFAASTEARLLEHEARPGGRLDGFELQMFKMNAADYGTPQKRRRVVIVGSRRDPIKEPRATHQRVPQLDTPTPWRTVRDAFTASNLALTPSDDRLPSQTQDYFGKSIPGSFKLEQLHVGRTYQEKSLERYSYIAPGRGRLDLPEELQYDCWRRLGSNGASDVLGRLEWDQPSVTIRTEFFKPEKGRYLHPEWTASGRQENRAITHAEAAVLQGFDDRHLWCGTKVGIARQIGNAVPPPLATAIAKQVRTLFM
ncbi:MAG: DNA (cytosine-5-)-methyltransferase [Nocardioides sp.]